MEIIEQEKKMTASYYDDYSDCSACGDITYSAAPRNT